MPKYKPYDKMNLEFMKFQNKLLSSDNKTILEKAYEYIFKYEVLALFEPEDSLFNIEEIHSLLEYINPLDSIYNEWLNNDMNINYLFLEHIHIFIERIKGNETTP